MSNKARSLGILPLALHPEPDDFNEDLQGLGLDRLTANLRAQLVPDDMALFSAS